MRADAQAKGQKPRYDGRCRDSPSGCAPASIPVVRFKNPNEGQVVLETLSKAGSSSTTRELDDLIIARSDGTPTYNFTVVVDDADMRITPRYSWRRSREQHAAPDQHVARARRDTPPVYAHLPMIHGPDGAKLSKRHGAVSVLEYREMGFLPRGAVELSVAARLVARRPGDLLRGRDGPAVRSRQRQSVGGELRPGEVAVGQSTAHAIGAGGSARTTLLRAQPSAARRRPGGRAAVDGGRCGAARAQPNHCRYGRSCALLLRGVRGFDPQAAASHLTAQSRSVRCRLLESRLRAVDDWSVGTTEQAVEQVAELPASSSARSLSRCA